MRLEWDAAKQRSNLRKHGVDFADVAEIFHGPLLVHPDTREEYGEERWIGVGVIRGRVMVIAFTDRGEDVLRIISLRKANRNERKNYEKAIQNELGTD
jgi:uncharacterized DUF497 family protein